MGADALDGVPWAGTLRPADAAETAALLADASAAGNAVVPCGGASKLHWGNRSDAEKLERLDLSALVDPLEVNAEEGIVSVAAGAGVGVASRNPRRIPRARRTNRSWKW